MQTWPLSLGNPQIVWISILRHFNPVWEIFPTSQHSLTICSNYILYVKATGVKFRYAYCMSTILIWLLWSYFRPHFLNCRKTLVQENSMAICSKITRFRSPLTYLIATILLVMVLYLYSYQGPSQPKPKPRTNFTSDQVFLDTFDQELENGTTTRQLPGCLIIGEYKNFSHFLFYVGTNII